VVPPPAIHTVVTGGMPGWQITLIATGAALFAAVVAVLLDRVRAARRGITARAA
jgi:biopolymer transport protein ExbB/TolQ